MNDNSLNNEEMLELFAARAQQLIWGQPPFTK